MTGIVLGFDANNNQGTILAKDGNRYVFTIEDWRDNTRPKKQMSVDFVVKENNSAGDIYEMSDKNGENVITLLGIAALALTFFFGFIGTFITRLFIAKESVDNILLHTAIHFILTVILIIPILGWVVYFLGTCTYMYLNYMLVTKQDTDD